MGLRIFISNTLSGDAAVAGPVIILREPLVRLFLLPLFSLQADKRLKRIYRESGQLMPTGEWERKAGVEEVVEGAPRDG